MGRYCADCVNYKTSDKKADGLCKCTKNKEYMLANTPECKNFEKAYARRSYDAEKLYDDAIETAKKSEWSKDNISVSTYAAIAVILGILALILNIFM